jgi:hypothetical protein
MARMRREIAQMEQEIPKLKQEAEKAQKKFDDLMAKNAAKEARDAQMRAGTDSLKRDLEKFPDQDFWYLRMKGGVVPKNERFQTRFMLQPPPPGPRSPELTPPIDMRFPATIPLQPALPYTIPFTTVIPISPYIHPVLLPFAPAQQTQPIILPFRGR